MPAASLDVGVDGRVGVVWTSAHEDELRDVYYAESTDRGLSYGTNYRVTPWPDGTQEFPDLCCDRDGAVRVLWNDSRPPSWDYDIYHAASLDGGATFGLPERVNDDPPDEPRGQEEVAAARMPAGGVVAVWRDGREWGEDNVYFAGPRWMDVADPAAGERWPPVPGSCSYPGFGPTLSRTPIRLCGPAEIWDATGRRVSVLPGYEPSSVEVQDFGFAATLLPSGVYWVCCPSGPRTAVRLVIIR